MKNSLKRLVSVFLCLVLLVSISAPAFAKNINGHFNSRGFKMLSWDTGHMRISCGCSVKA